MNTLTPVLYRQSFAHQLIDGRHNNALSTVAYALYGKHNADPSTVKCMFLYQDVTLGDCHGTKNT